MKCENCLAYVYEKQHCHRYPKIEEKVPHDWCLEFKAKEVIVCPVEEKEKASEARVEEKAVESEPAKRGWPKGKPRK